MRSKEAEQENEQLRVPENLTLLPILQPDYSAAELKAQFHHNTFLLTTDFTVRLQEDSQEIRDDEGVLLGYAFPQEQLVTIDHHIDHPEMARHISATNLMIRFVEMMKSFKPSQAREQFVQIMREANPTFNPNLQQAEVVISHTDLDSIFAGLIGAGVLPPDEEIYGRRAIMADHTGEEDDLVDYLMGIDRKRNIPLAVDVINRWQKGLPQSAEAEADFQRRKHHREIAKRVVAETTNVGHDVYFAQFPERIEFSSELLPPAKPEAAAFVIAMPMKPDSVHPENLEIKLRAGLAFPEGASLMHVPYEKWWNFGGRYDAGNNTRGGGFPQIDFNGRKTNPMSVASAISDYLDKH